MNAIRPDSLDTFIGQTQARSILRILINASRKRHEPLPHLLFISGFPGLGKTTLSRILAGEMGGSLIEVVGAGIRDTDEMVSILQELKPMDCLFLDEIHAIPRAVEEILYGAMEDRVVNVVDRGFDTLMKSIGMGSGSGGKKARKTVTLPPFCLIGATTTQGELSSPLRSRFQQTISLVPYTCDELATIIINASHKLSFQLPPDIAQEIARRSRSTARLALGNLVFYRDFVQGSDLQVNQESIQACFQLKGVDSDGLMERDRQYLRALQGGQAVGLETLSACLNESVETITDSVEPYLFQLGRVRKTARGRVLV